jgi:hypothetical protein
VQRRVSDTATKPGQRLLPLAAKGHCRPKGVLAGSQLDARQRTFTLPAPAV